MLFSRDQEASETFDTYLASLRRLASFCKFVQLEEELIRDRTVVGTKDGGVKVCLLREPPLTLDQGAMMNVAKIANVETKKKQWVAPILIKTISSKPVVKCQIDSGASAPR